MTHRRARLAPSTEPHVQAFDTHAAKPSRYLGTSIAGSSLHRDRIDSGMLQQRGLYCLARVQFKTGLTSLRFDESRCCCA
jgi:hypothetical protein